jgi:hypothetical protein
LREDELETLLQAGKLFRCGTRPVQIRKEARN